MQESHVDSQPAYSESSPPPVVVRCIVDSWAAGAASELDWLGDIDEVFVFGGGSQSAFFRARLGEVTGLPLLFWDERFTTVEAEDHLLSAGLTNKRRKARRDRVAAQILLQSYLDAGCPGEAEQRDLHLGEEE